MNTDVLTILISAIFVFGVVALLALGARSFTALVELILRNGSQLDQLTREVRQVQTHLSSVTADNSYSARMAGIPTMPVSPSVPSTESTGTTKFPKS